jgi:serine/threonine protein kinase
MSTPLPHGGQSQSGQSKSSSLPVGYQLGEYKIAALLGHGGFGMTYKALDTKLGLDVAIKEYFPDVYATRNDASTIVPGPGADLSNYEWGLGEFLKEAQALAKFKHPNIVRVLRFLEANGTAYMIMEYEQGETLSGYLKRHGGLLEEATLVRLFLPILSGLQAVHDAGLLHLDIKPDNIYLRANEQPMLIDFGSSRQLRGDAAQKVTLTPGYCSLEQYPGHGDIGPWSDVYSMAATIYRCITGKGPIDSLERHQTFARKRMDPLRPAVSIERPIYSAHIRQCVDQSLRLSSGERPASAFIMQQGLMGKDMAQVAKPARQTLYRPGRGFIGVVAHAEEKKKAHGRPGFEKLIAVLVFVTTFVVITPKILIDTSYLTPGELYEWIDQTQTDTVAWFSELGEQINERVFGEKRKPKVAKAPPTRRAPVTEPAPVAVEAPAVPFGADKRHALDIPLPEGKLRAFGFLKHGAVLAVATDDGAVQLWDAQTGEPRVKLALQVSTPAALGIYPSTQWFAASNREHAIVVFDPLGNIEMKLVNDPPRPIVAITVSPTNRLLAEADADGSVRIWELSQVRKLHTLSADGSAAQVLAFSPDERFLATADNGGNVALWDIAQSKRVAHWRAHPRAVATLTFSPDGNWLATAGDDLRLWPTTEPWSPGRMPDDAPPYPHSVAFSPDGQWLIAAGAIGPVHVWRTDSDTLEHTIAGNDRPLLALTVARDGKLFATAREDNVIRLWK